MDDTVAFVVLSSVLGVGGALAMDAWAFFLGRFFSVSSLDYAMVGRWVGHIGRGKARHQFIGSSPPIRHERLLGYVVHYLIGVACAALLLLVWGLDWAEHPTVVPALAVGLGTLVAPWLVMQPAFGLGIAGASTPSPAVTRAKSAAAHTAYGFGLYGSAIVLNATGVL